MAEKQQPPPREDPLIDEVRAVRKALSERFEGDIDKLCDHLAEIEARYRNRVVRPDRPAKQG